MRVVQLGDGHDWRPMKARVCATRSRAWEKVEALQCAAVEFDQPFTAFLMPRSVLHLPIAQKQFTKERETQSLPDHLYATGPDESFPGSLCQFAKALLETTQPSLDLMAECVGFTPRTLQRELAKEGPSFRRVVDQARFESAAALLARNNLKTHEIARRVGYTDGPHFARAFRRWTALSASFAGSSNGISKIDQTFAPPKSITQFFIRASQLHSGNRNIHCA